MDLSPAGQEISTILRHDDKQTSYKIALLRSINDVVLNFPDLDASGRDVAIPLLTLADFWIAYYWPLVDAEAYPSRATGRTRRRVAQRYGLSPGVNNAA